MNGILDDLVWQKFIDGDTASFKSIMEKHFRTLFHYGLKIIKNEELVKDTIQELFFTLWRRKENLSKEVNIKAYLLSSLRRSLCRKIHALDKFKKFADYENKQVAFDFEVSVEQRYITSESNRLLAVTLGKYIADLPKRQKEVIYLKFYVNLEREDIAEVMGISVQTVSNIFQMALKNLRENMKKSNSSETYFLTLLPLLTIFSEILLN